MLRVPRLTLLTTGLSLVAVLGRTAAQAPTSGADKKAIRAIIAEAVASLHAGAPERWTAIFADDAVLMFPGRPAITGREAIRNYAGEHFQRFRSEVNIEPMEIQVSGDWAFARTAVSGRFSPKDGSTPIELDYKEIAIYQRQPDGNWKVARLIGNSNRPVQRRQT